ncbi:DegV family protein [Lachnobacterium bovis]|uniref:EDD domain protein, DegV family n=1 Tax=Lachnobacterium bovis TaxID=140626 RepID=A0A1H9TS75_9FIRM|nr:DegV family protein [Lachnobacterium bovis]SER99986.1 EDD domain protein, DegV family [Lachnobacterium bovis]
MSKVVVVTDSSCAFTQDEAKKVGVEIVPLPFYINGEIKYEDVDLTQEDFYQKLQEGVELKTSMPLLGDVTDKWDELLEKYDEVVYIPLSAGLSSSCETAIMLAQDYDGRVQVVNNKRVSVTLKRSVYDAVELAEQGKSAKEIKEILEKTAHDSSIYIMVDTLSYLKKGGRITAAAAAIGTLLKIKPVLQIQGDKLDAFSKARTIKQAKSTMIKAIKDDFEKKYNDPEGKNMYIQVAYTHNLEDALAFKEEVENEFPGIEVKMDPLSLCIACHIGPGSLAVAYSKKVEA